MFEIGGKNKETSNFIMLASVAGIVGIVNGDFTNLVLKAE